jgi:predicted RecB family nuclease
MAQLTDIKGIGPAKADTLEENGYDSVEDVAQADPNNLSEISGISEERALEYMVEAGNLLDEESVDDSEQDEEDSGEEFDLTPSEVSDELEGEAEEENDDIPEVEAVDEEDSDDESNADSESGDDSEKSEESSYDVSIEFETMLQYDVFHAALMRHHERVYTSYQPDADAMQKFLDQLDDFNSVSYELTESELNTLHTAVKQCRSNYQGDNMIDHMDALIPIEEQIQVAREEHLF